MFKVKASTWFTEMGSTKPIGIVIVQNKVGEEKAYIGTGVGTKQMEDEYNIANMGAKFPVDQAKTIIGVQ